LQVAERTIISPTDSVFALYSRNQRTTRPLAAPMLSFLANLPTFLGIFVFTNQSK
jgi:hypothetical protein